MALIDDWISGTKRQAWVGVPPLPSPWVLTLAAFSSPLPYPLGPHPGGFFVVRRELHAVSAPGRVVVHQPGLVAVPHQAVELLVVQ